MDNIELMHVLDLVDEMNREIKIKDREKIALKKEEENGCQDTQN